MCLLKEPSLSLAFSPVWGIFVLHICIHREGPDLDASRFIDVRDLCVFPQTCLSHKRLGNYLCEIFTSECLLLMHFDMFHSTNCFYITNTRHERHEGVSNNQHIDYLFNSLFKQTTMETSQVRITGTLWGESIGDGWKRQNTGKYEGITKNRIIYVDGVVVANNFIIVNCIVTQTHLLIEFLHWAVRNLKHLMGSRRTDV